MIKTFINCFFLSHVLGEDIGPIVALVDGELALNPRSGLVCERTGGRICRKKVISRLESSACCAAAGLPRALTIRNGRESYPDCSMLEVNPLADVPRANLPRLCKRLQPSCKPTDAEDSTDDGNRNYAFV